MKRWKPASDGQPQSSKAHSLGMTLILCYNLDKLHIHSLTTLPHIMSYGNCFDEAILDQISL